MRGDSSSYKCSSVLNLPMDGLPACLLDWCLKLDSLRNAHVGETRPILQQFHHSHLLRVSVGNVTFQSATGALLKALNSLGFFSPGLAQCSFLWAALSGRSEIEDSLLSAVVFFWQLWALVFCWQVVLGPNMLWFFQALCWICVPVVKKSRNCPFIWKPTERPIPLMGTFGNIAKSPLILVCYTAKFMVHGCEHQGTCQNVGCLHLHQSSLSRAVVTEGAFFVPH